MALCLMPAADSPELLFILRAEHGGDPWSGHVAFPGGRRHAHDESLWATAAREAREEIALDLNAIGDRLAQLDDVHPRTPVLPSIAITPFVVGVPADTTPHPGPEVDELFWIPLLDLANPRYRDYVEIPGPAGPQAHPSIRYGRYEIWGLTHRIVTQLLELVSEGGAAGERRASPPTPR